MLEYLIDDELVSKDDRLAVGVSGGADSMLLLWAIIQKQRKVGFSFKVLHVNHHLRGLSSDGDAEFVEDFCKKRKIDYKIIDVDVKSLKVSEKMTLEQSAREARYRAIYAEMKAEKLNKLFLAHHKNDQAETILMHIFRGAGISGACGIKPADVIKRPLLNLDKTEILNLVHENGIEFVTDNSNFDNTYSRNFIRNVVLPEIQKIYPNAVDSICLFGQKCLEIQTYIESLVDNSLIIESDDYILIKDAVFENPSFIFYEYIKQVFGKLKIYSDIEAKHYDLILKLAKNQVNSSIDLPHGVVAKRTYGGVKILKKKAVKTYSKEFEFVVGEITFENYGTIKTSIIKNDEVVYGDGSLYVDLDKISTNAIWRVRKVGDMFSKLGTGSKKLNDYFTDKKVDVDVRDFVPVLANGSQILVVAGLDVSENVKVDGETETILRLEFKEL